MPRIARFASAEIAMYFADHPPPHFHVLGRDGAAQVDIESLEVIASDSTADDAGGNRQAQACLGAIIATNENCKQSIGETSRVLIDAIEIRFVVETLRRCERSGESGQEGLRTR